MIFKKSWTVPTAMLNQETFEKFESGAQFEDLKCAIITVIEQCCFSSTPDRFFVGYEDTN